MSVIEIIMTSIITLIILMTGIMCSFRLIKKQYKDCAEKTGIIISMTVPIIAFILYCMIIGYELTKQ